jgi:hypothetical protein
MTEIAIKVFPNILLVLALPLISKIALHNDNECKRCTHVVRRASGRRAVVLVVAVGAVALAVAPRAPRHAPARLRTAAAARALELRRQACELHTRTSSFLLSKG